MDAAQIKAKLDSVHHLENQAPVLEEAVNAMEDIDAATTAALVPAVLALFERCGHEDDFGMFSSLRGDFERVADDAASRAAVQASVRRAPSWPTLQLLPSFSTPAETRAILTQVLADGSFKDPRYSREWLEARLEELSAAEPN